MLKSSYSITAIAMLALAMMPSVMANPFAVPDAGSSALMLVLGSAALIAGRRLVGRK